MRLNIEGEVQNLPAVWWDSEVRKVRLIDQTKLPFETKIFTCNTYQEVANAIKTMRIRGAPSIGAAAAYGLALAIDEYWDDDNYIDKIKTAYDHLLMARPTAVDLKNGLKWVMSDWKVNPESAIKLAKSFADNLAEQSKKIGEIGKTLIKEGMNILTHCHTGALAVVDHGTALAPIIQAWEDGIRFHVYVDETRPRIQGRLTSWELSQYDIDHTVICDSSSGYLMNTWKVDFVILGADRVARNGDIANKIGTYNLAVLANHHNIPFYTAFPESTFDPNTKSGNEIVIEERGLNEVYEIKGYSQKNKRIDSITIYDQKANFINPAFDVTPASFIHGYITSHGILTKEQLLEKVGAIKES